MKFYRRSADRRSSDKVEDIVKKNNLASFELDKLKIAYSPLPTKEHAFPTPHREAKNYPFYVITHKRMYRNQSCNYGNNVILNQALGKDAATNYVQINAATAEAIGRQKRRHGDDRNQRGKINGRLRLCKAFDRTRSRCHITMEQWSAGYSPMGRNGTCDQSGA